MSPELSDYELWENADVALQVALIEGCRGRRVTAPPFVQGRILQTRDSAELSRLFKGCHQLGRNRFGFDYPVVIYPQAYTVVGQYALHTHLVFSVERSVGGVKTPYHEAFETFSEYLQTQIEEARTGDHMDQISKLFESAVLQFRKQNSVLSRAHAIDDKAKMERVCFLWSNGLQKPTSDIPTIVSKKPIYNEIFHVTGLQFATSEEVARYILDSGCGDAKGSKEERCGCSEEAQRTLDTPDRVDSLPLTSGADPGDQAVIPNTSAEDSALPLTAFFEELQYSAAEGGPPTQITVALSQNADRAITIGIATDPPTGDFRLSATDLTFSTGDTIANVLIEAIEGQRCSGRNSGDTFSIRFPQI